jgi:hypothetical protein
MDRVFCVVRLCRCDSPSGNLHVTFWGLYELVRARTSSIEQKRYKSHQIPQVTYNLSEVLIDNATKKLSSPKKLLESV